jgi:hypothetical protein
MRSPPPPYQQQSAQAAHQQRQGRRLRYRRRWRRFHIGVAVHLEFGNGVFAVAAVAYQCKGGGVDWRD